MLLARAPLRIDLAGGWTDVPFFADREGGAVVNVTIDRYVTARLHDVGAMAIEHDVLAGGLGSSACEHVLREMLRDPGADHATVAERAYAAECAAGVIGGRQDQYAACFGGLNFMRFGTGAGAAPVLVDPVDVPGDLLVELESRLVLVDSGVQRLSGAIHDAVWGGYARGEHAVADALRSLKCCAARMRDALLAGDLDAVGDVMAENWTMQKRLHASVTNARVEDIFALASKAGAVAGKACGAGGGGALVFCAPSTAGAAPLRTALHDAAVALIDLRFDHRRAAIEPHPDDVGVR